MVINGRNEQIWWVKIKSSTLGRKRISPNTMTQGKYIPVMLTAMVATPAVTKQAASVLNSSRRMLAKFTYKKLLEAEKQAALDRAKEMAEKDAKQNELPAPADEETTVFTQRDLIQFEDFEKVQLVVAKVLKCEKVPKADKLLMSTLKVGDTERVVVSGIAKFYTPEEMVGKKVVLLANLAPRKIRGVESHGMLLCAANADDSKLSLLTVDSDMEDGCEIG